MTQLAGALFLCSILGYGVAAVLYAWGLTRHREEAVQGAFAALFVAALNHTVVGVLHVAEFRRLPLGGGGDDPAAGAWDHPFALIASLLVVSVVAAGIARSKVRVIGAFVAPVALGLSLGALLVGEMGSGAAFLPSGLASTWLPVHTLANYSSLAFFSLAFASGIVYLIQHGRLKTKALPIRQSGKLRLPSLEMLDTVNRTGFALGLGFLTIGIVSGTFWAVAGAAEGADLRPKVVATLGIWLLYALGWQARSLLGWGGRRAAWIAIIGFVGLIASVVGVAHS